MPRVKRGTVRRAKRKKLLARAKGFYQTKSKLYRAAKESVDTALKYAYVGRKNKKREYRRLWVVRINAAARENGLTYSQMMRGLKAAGSTIDRKILADRAATQPAPFPKVAAQATPALPAPRPRPHSRLPDQCTVPQARCSMLDWLGIEHDALAHWPFDTLRVTPGRIEGLPRAGVEG